MATRQLPRGLGTTPGLRLRLGVGPASIRTIARGTRWLRSCSQTEEREANVGGLEASSFVDKGQAVELLPIIRTPAPQVSAKPEWPRKPDGEKVDDDESKPARPRAWLKHEQAAPERRRDDAEDDMPPVTLRPPPHGQGDAKKEHDQCHDIVDIGGHFTCILSHWLVSLKRRHTR